MEEILYGTGVVLGIGIATVIVLLSDVTDDLKQYEAGTPVLEASRLANAIQTASAELVQLKEAAWGAVNRSRQIFTGGYRSGRCNKPNYE